jgi:hypothetical protein
VTTVSFVGAGTRATNTNGNITPTLPTGLLTGDLLIAWAQSASSAITFTPPSGWSTLTTIVDSSGPTLSIFWKAYASGDADPLLTKVGSASGATVLGKVVAYRNADVTTGPVNGTAYNTGATAGANAGPISGVAVTGDGRVLLLAAWGDDYGTAPATPSGWTLIVNDTAGSTAGVSYHASDQSVVGASSSAVTVTGHPTANATRVGVQIAINEGTAQASASGSLTLSGAPTPSGAASATGSLTLGGTATGSKPASGTGSLTLGGTATPLGPNTTGQLTLGGAPAAQARATASGTLTLAGSATAQARAPGATGVLSLSGTPAPKAAAAASGSLSLSGAPVQASFRFQVWTGTAWKPITPLVWDGATWRSDITVTVVPAIG